MVGHRPARALKEAWAVHTGLNGAWTVVAAMSDT